MQIFDEKEFSYLNERRVLMGRDGFVPATHGFSVHKSTHNILIYKDLKAV